MELAQGTHATIFAIPLSAHDRSIHETKHDGKSSLPGWLACKTVYDDHPRLHPHDVKVEIRILSTTRHENIVELFKVDHNDDLTLGRYDLFLPLLPMTLNDLLSNPSFSPLETSPPFTTLYSDIHNTTAIGFTASPLQSRQSLFTTATTSIIYQLTSGISYLHSLKPPIAHRDLKPSNVMIGFNGVIKIIDFGTAWIEEESADRNRLVCEVGTGGYRSPELLFGYREYDPFAIDAWALGCIIAQLYTPFAKVTRAEDVVINVDELSELDVLKTFTTVRGDDDSDSEDEEEEKKRDAMMVDIRRQSLFNGSMGDLGLIWSIVRVRGTPNSDTWPEFTTLPDANKLSFIETPRINLRRCLPQLIGPDQSDILNILEGLLDYSPSRRMKVMVVRDHSLFANPREADGRAILQGFIPPRNDLIRTPNDDNDLYTKND